MNNLIKQLNIKSPTKNIYEVAKIITNQNIIDWEKYIIKNPINYEKK